MCRSQALQGAQVSRCDLPVRYSRHQAHVRVCKFETRYHCSRHEARTHYTDSTPVQNLSMNDDTIDSSKMILLHHAGASVVHLSLALTRSALITLQDLNRRLTRITSKRVEYLGVKDRHVEQEDGVNYKDTVQDLCYYFTTPVCLHCPYCPHQDPCLSPSRLRVRSPTS